MSALMARLRALAGDKRVLWGGVALAAAAGAFVLWRRHQAGAKGGGTSTATDASSVAPGGGFAGFPDTTGSDVASWLGQYSESLQRQTQGQLADYFAELQDQITALKNVPPSGTPQQTSPYPPGSIVIVANPQPKPKTSPAVRYRAMFPR